MLEPGSLKSINLAPHNKDYHNVTIASCASSSITLGLNGDHFCSTPHLWNVQMPYEADYFMFFLLV